MSNPHITKCEDGSILIEWVFKNARFYFALEYNAAESSWGYVSIGNDMILENGLLPQAMQQSLSNLEVE